MCSQMRHRFGAVLCRWSWPLLCVLSSIRSNLNLIPIKTTSSVNQTHCALPSGARHVLHRLARPSLGMTRSLSLLPCHLLARLSRWPLLLPSLAGSLSRLAVLWPSKRTSLFHCLFTTGEWQVWRYHYLDIGRRHSRQSIHFNL